MSRYEGRLELTWTNKAQRLLAHEDGSYEWVPPSDYRVAEVRLLHDAGAVGSVHPVRERTKDNLLIYGDALSALTSLIELPEFAKEYVGKVKLAYLDPPFNTQQAFPHYDDALEHSVWLTMMRDRLAQIQTLLRNDGSVWVHLDDIEAASCKIVLDELFGRESFVASIVWEKDQGRRSDTDVSTVHDYILIYAKDHQAWKATRRLLPRSEGQISRYRNPDNDPRGPWFQYADSTAKSGSEKNRFEVELPSGRKTRPPKGVYWRFSPETYEKALAENRVYFGSGGDGMPIIKRYLSEVQEGVVPRTWWPASEAGSNMSAKRDHLRRMFPDLEPFATPKPEALLRRIIQIASGPDDIVLDCFAGSGTTAAVAQKMGRRWIAIERAASTVDKYTLPRLQKVVAGEDPDGITSVEVLTGEDLPEGVKAGASRAAAKVLDAWSKAGALDGLDEPTMDKLIKLLRDADKTKTEITWFGGGGFRVLRVAPSMFEAQSGRVFLSEWVTNGRLSEVTAAQLHYEYISEPPFCGRKGRFRLAVVDGLVDANVVRLLLTALPEDQLLTVCGTAIDPEARDVVRMLRQGSTVRKIPQSILREYRQTARRLGELGPARPAREAAPS